MKQSLNTKLTQNLVLTPQLQQSLLLLQLPAVELEQDIQQALETNPLLERVEIPPPTQANELTDKQTSHTPEENLEINWQETFENRRLSQNAAPSLGQADSNQANKEETLTEHLLWQIQMTSLSEKDKAIAITLIHCLNEEGYQTMNLTEIQALFAAEMEVDEDEVHAVSSLIKTLDPIGVGAENLQERLLILLKQLDQSASGLTLASQIIDQYLPQLGNRDLTQIRKQTGCSEQELTTSIQLIALLEPRIMANYQSNSNNYIVPDVITKQIDNHWRVELNPDNHHKLSINRTYASLLDSRLDKKQKEYIQDNLQQAKSFIKGLSNRYDTLLQVAEAVVERQQDFLEHGEQYLRPMVLQDIAQQLELHESTISRATAGKYLLTPRGVFELKYFFPSSLHSANGSNTSSTAIRSLIKKMIDEEPHNKPLSDSKITAILEQQGHQIARRTVAKYRESMNLQPSSRRKSLI